MMEKTTQYQAGAYDSSNIKLQPREGKASLVDKLRTVGSEFLPWTKPIPIICTAVCADVLPSQFPQCSELDDDSDVFWTNKRLIGFIGNGWAKALILGKRFGQLMVFGFGAVSLMECILFLLLGIGGDFLSGAIDDSINVFEGYLMYAGLPGLFFWFFGDFYIRGIIRIKLLDGLFKVRKLYELSRETGMVTLYDSDGEVKFCYPFLEFDCLFQTTITQNGVYLYQLMLKHRYTSQAYGVPLGTLMANKEVSSDYYRLWNMIQLFMDISQPLPDTYYLEEFREFDPVTKAYDEQTGRNPRYWRDMSDEEYQCVMDNIRDSQRGCTLGEHINIFQSE